MYQKVLSYIRKFHMIEKGDRVIAGVSGGADSVCLLLCLDKLRQELPFTLQVIHVEHGIRGAESLADAAFVKDLCEKRNIPVQICPVDATGYAAEQGLSVEEAGRILRYKLFEEAGRRLERESRESQEGAEHPGESGQRKAKIAVAHNRNDQAETLLLNLIRGSRTKGLGAMQPVRDGIIRPLLECERAEIEAFLEQECQPYCTDRTNLETIYARNRIRREVLPVLCGINACAVEHLAETAETMRETEEFLAAETEKAMKICTERGGAEILIRREPYMEQEKLIRNRILYETMAIAAGKKKDLTAEHVAALEALMENQPGRQAVLPYDVKAERIYEGIRLKRSLTAQKTAGSETVYEAGIPGPAGADCDAGKDNEKILLETEWGKFIFRRLKCGNEPEFPKKKYTKWFDYDKIKSSLQIRTRQAGDYFALDEMGREQKLKRYFINEKIPQEEREQIPLLCEGHHVLWIVGSRISAWFKVTKDTENILEVQFYGGKES